MASFALGDASGSPLYITNMLTFGCTRDEKAKLPVRLGSQCLWVTQRAGEPSEPAKSRR